VFFWARKNVSGLESDKMKDVKRGSMKIWHFFVLVVLIIIVSSPFSHGEEKYGEWQMVNEVDGIIGYARTTSKSSVREIKAVGIIDAPAAVIEAVIRDFSAQPEYMFMCAEGYKVEIPGYQNTGDVQHLYHRMDMPWPVADRFFIGKTQASIDGEKGSLYLSVQNISCDFKPVEKNMVRMPIVEGQWVLTPAGENKTEVSYQALGDPGGNLPAFLINMITKNMCLETIQGLRKMVRKDKYRNAKFIVTKTTHKISEGK